MEKLEKKRSKNRQNGMKTAAVYGGKNGVALRCSCNLPARRGFRLTRGVPKFEFFFDQ
jgi:hypothetical protein